MSSSQYDAIARDYSAPSRHEHLIGRMNYETWLEELGGVSGLRVLDLGCGSGHTSRLLAMRGAIVTGLDISSEMITIARAAEKHQRLGIAYVQSDATRVLLGERYEVVTPTYLFNYTTSKEELLEMAHTTASHLLPGGKMVALNLSQRPIVPRLRNGQHASAWFPGDAPWKDGSRVSFVIFDIKRADRHSVLVDQHLSRCLRGRRPRRHFVDTYPGFQGLHGTLRQLARTCRAQHLDRDHRSHAVIFAGPMWSGVLLSQRTI